MVVLLITYFISRYFRGLQVFQDSMVSEDSLDQRYAHNNNNNYNNSLKCTLCAQSSLNWIYWHFFLQGPPGDPGPQGPKVRQINNILTTEVSHSSSEECLGTECFLCFCSGYYGKRPQGCQRRPGKPSFIINIVKMNDIIWMNVH